MNKENQNDPNLPAVVSSSAGVVAGGVATSGAAMGATGAGGVTGYVLGASSLVGHAACEVAAAVGLGTVVAGPILGGLVGYGIYRGVKKAVRG